MEAVEEVNIEECPIPNRYKRILLLCMYHCIVLKKYVPVQTTLRNTSSESIKTIHRMHHYTLELIGFIKRQTRSKIMNKLWEIRTLHILEKIRCPKGCTPNTANHITYAKDAYMKHFEVIVDYFENEYDVRLRKSDFKKKKRGKNMEKEIIVIL